MATKRACAKSKDYVDSSDDSEVEPESFGSKKSKETKKGTKQTKKGVKVAKISASDSNSDQESADTNSWPLSAKRFVTVNNFHGKLMVDIREFYQDDSGEMKPGKKGISLNEDQWASLKKLIPEIDAKLSDN